MRMIERWFPCDEVSRESPRGWGSGNSEKSLFTWFAARPLAQARAAVLTSLLPWPDDVAEQDRLKALVREAMKGRDSAHAQVVAELKKHYPDGSQVLDMFSGRAIIPLEAARYGVQAWGIDYSPVATLAGQLLADYPARDWSNEPPLPFGSQAENPLRPRLVDDVKAVLAEVGRRFREKMAPYYPTHNGAQPWGYLWAITLPCQNCGRRFPMTGSLELRRAHPRNGDRGQSYRIIAERESGTYSISVHDGPPVGRPTRVVAQGKSRFDSSGKVAVCPFCDHIHKKEVHTRLMVEGQGRDEILVAADIVGKGGKHFREPTEVERQAAQEAEAALKNEVPFPNGLAAVPDERIPPGNTWTIQPLVYGAKTFGDLCTARQTLGFVHLCRSINEVGLQVLEAGFSRDYAAALCGYAASAMARKFRRSTRGATVEVVDGNARVHDIFGSSESSISFSYDFFEVALGDSAGGWESLCRDTVRAVENQCEATKSASATIQRASATALPFSDSSLSAVVTDPPYDEMIEYADASDLFFVWIKRALATTQPELAFTFDPYGNQEKTEEIIVKKGGGRGEGEHRNRAHYDTLLSKAFSEAQRVTRRDGVVSIVFGHGDPEVWQRMLNILSGAGLVLTGSWPAQTESGGQEGSANIRTTLTMACRPASPNRSPGRVSEVTELVKKEVCDRVPKWEKAGLALIDQLMASAGPAMEIVGRYSEIVDRKGEVSEPKRFLIEARRAVQEAVGLKIEGLPLETFDTRTRFALFWARAFHRSLTAKSEARWQALASDLKLEDLKGILIEPTKGKDKGLRLVYASETNRTIDENSSTIDVALAMARAWSDGLEAAAQVLALAGRDKDDAYLWAALAYLAECLPDGDVDGRAWTSLSRARNNIVVAATLARDSRSHGRKGFVDPNQPSLFDALT